MKCQIKIIENADGTFGTAYKYHFNRSFIDRADSFGSREDVESYLRNVWDWDGRKISKNIYVITTENPR